MKNLIKPVVLLIFVFVRIKSNAQQTILFNTYVYDPMQLNIAYAAHECSEANLNYRNQWLGLKDAPKLYQVNAHSPLGMNTGAAIRIASQQSGLLNGIQFTAGYGYQVRMDQKTKVLFGLGVGFLQNTLNAQKATVIDDNDATLSDAGKQRAMGFDSELGVQFLNDKLKAGFSVLHLYTSKSNFTGSAYKTLPQLNFTASYIINLNKQLDLEPMLVDRHTLKGTNVADGILNLHYNKMISAGIGYRSNYGLLAIVGLKIDKFKIAYSFDYGVSKNRTLSGSSHQILLGFYYCKPRTEKRSTKSRRLMKTKF